MKHLLLLLTSFLLTSVNVAVAKSATDSATAPVVMHSALVDTPEVIDVSRADPTNWPLPSSPTLPSKGWRYFEENRIAGE